MKRIVVMIVITILLVVFSAAYADGLLPSLTDVVGISMPSFGETANRFPEEESEEVGSTIERYINVSEEEFNSFNIHLEEIGASIQDYSVSNNVLTATILYKDSSMSIQFDSKNAEIILTYPPHTFDGWLVKYKRDYADGVEKRNNKDWDGAVEAFTMAGDYSDAKTQIMQTRYIQAETLEIEGDQEAAYQLFISLGTYSDSFERANKPYYEQGVAFRESKDYIEAAEAFMHAGTYNEANQLSLEMYYLQAELDLSKKRYVDALVHFRLAGEYKDSLVRAIELEYRFHELITYSEYNKFAFAITADGEILTSDDTLEGDLLSSGIVRFDAIPNNVVGITHDGKIKLRGSCNKLALAKSWNNITSVQYTGDTIFALSSNGKVLAVSDVDRQNLDGLSSWKNIQKIIYGHFNEWAYGTLTGLDSNGNLLMYDCYRGTTMMVKGNYTDITVTFSNLYALAQDGTVYLYEKDKKAWNATESNWYTQILLGQDRVTGISADNDIVAMGKNYEGTILWKLHLDGTLTSEINSNNTANWKLWNDQEKLAEIFTWSISAPEKDFEAIYDSASDMLEEDAPGAYELLSSIIEYEPARELINSNKKLTKIRDERFGKGKKINLGEKNPSGLLSFTILDQKKGSILVISDSLFSGNAGYDRVHFKDFKETTLYDSYISPIFTRVFSEREQKTMLPVTSGVFKGDKIFLLSKNEVQKYFPKPVDRIRGHDWITSSVTRRYTNELEMVVGSDGSFSAIIGNGKTLYYPIAFWIDLNQLPLAEQ